MQAGADRAGAEEASSEHDARSGPAGSSRLLQEVIHRAGLWAETASQRVLREGAAPTVEQKHVARLAGVERVNEIRLQQTSSLPYPQDPLLHRMCRRTGFLGADTLGVTLGHAICLRPAVADNTEIFAHECCHVAQVERFGSISAFVRAYLEEILTFGYANAPLEIEARSVGSSLARRVGTGATEQ